MRTWERKKCVCLEQKAKQKTFRLRKSIVAVTFLSLEGAENQKPPAKRRWFLV